MCRSPRCLLSLCRYLREPEREAQRIITEEYLSWEVSHIRRSSEKHLRSGLKMRRTHLPILAKNEAIYLRIPVSSVPCFTRSLSLSRATAVIKNVWGHLGRRRSPVHRASLVRTSLRFVRRCRTFYPRSKTFLMPFIVWYAFLLFVSEGSFFPTSSRRSFEIASILHQEAIMWR